MTQSPSATTRWPLPDIGSPEIIQVREAILKLAEVKDYAEKAVRGCDCGTPGSVIMGVVSQLADELRAAADACDSTQMPDVRKLCALARLAASVLEDLQKREDKENKTPAPG